MLGPMRIAMKGNSAVVLFVFSAVCASAEPIAWPTTSETRQSSIGYPSVATALDALRARNDVRVSTEGGWTVITEIGGRILWSFTPPGHPAHPAAIRRVMSQKDGAWYVTMNVLCQADKVPCDQLVQEFNVLNERMREFIERNHKAQQSAPRDAPETERP